MGKKVPSFKLAKPVLKLAIVVSIFFSNQISHASINKDMAEMFNGMSGGSTNYTNAGSFHGQAGNLYTGGSVSVRVPQSNIQLANAQLPSISAGCGGIDFFAGSFSFVNKEQFIAFTRNLGNNAAGVAFDLALKALDPMIQDSIDGIRNIVNKINQSNLDSCEAARQVVGGVMGKIGESMNNSCKAETVANGTAEDGAGARWLCSYGGYLADAANKSVGTNKPTNVITFTGGNLAYMAFKRHIYGYTNMDQDTQDFLMSLTGTVVYTPPEKNGKNDVLSGPKYFTPTITSAKQLLGENANTKNVTVSLIQCRGGGDGDNKENRKNTNCTVVENKQIESFRWKVAQLLKKFPEKIRNNSSWSNAELDSIASVADSTSLPVLKMAISDAFLNTNTLSTNSVLDVITIEYVAKLLERYEKDLRPALAQYSQTDEAADQQKILMIKNLDQLRETLRGERVQALKVMEHEQAILNSLRQNEQIWRQQFADMSNSLDFDVANRY